MSYNNVFSSFQFIYDLFTSCVAFKFRNLHYSPTFPERKDSSFNSPPFQGRVPEGGGGSFPRRSTRRGRWFLPKLTRIARCFLQFPSFLRCEFRWIG